jgi:hypothetical protein
MGFLFLEGVWECDSECFLKCFFVKKYIKINYFLKIIFNISILK